MAIEAFLWIKLISCYQDRFDIAKINKYNARKEEEFDG